MAEEEATKEIAEAIRELAEQVDELGNAIYAAGKVIARAIASGTDPVDTV